MQVYLVGGAVRDELLGRPIKDKDFVVVGTTVADMLAAGFQQVGADFPVFLHPTSQQEYALARTERKLGHGYQGFSVHSSPDVSLQEDLQRRDLTVNAMAIEVISLTDDTPITGDVIDYYGGLDDIKCKTLRHVSDAFSEDPLRVLRTARFYGRYHGLGFEVAEETLTLMRQLVASGELAHLSSERIWQESSRAMMQSEPNIYWQLLDDIGALATLYPDLQQAWQDRTVRGIILSGLTFAGRMYLEIIQRWALLTASFIPQHVINNRFDKNSVDEDARAHHSTSDDLDAAANTVNKLGNTAKVPKALTQFAKLYIEHADKLAICDALSAAETVDLIQRTGAHKQPDKLTKLLMVSQVITLARQQQAIQHALTCFNNVTMNDIDETLTGVAIGDALRKTRIDRVQAQHSG